jgi:hypothetical protein
MRDSEDDREDAAPLQTSTAPDPSRRAADAPPLRHFAAIQRFRKRFRKVCASPRPSENVKV